MTGRIIHQPPEPHECDPGWIRDDDGKPTRSTPPVGSIWRCTCDRTWIATDRYQYRGHTFYTVTWRPESRIRRWWRTLGTEKRGGYPSGNLTIYDVEPPTHGVVQVESKEAN